MFPSTGIGMTTNNEEINSPSTSPNHSKSNALTALACDYSDSESEPEDSSETMDFIPPQSQSVPLQSLATPAPVSSRILCDNGDKNQPSTLTFQLPLSLATFKEISQQNPLKPSDNDNEVEMIGTQGSEAFTAVRIKEEQITDDEDEEAGSVCTGIQSHSETEDSEQDSEASDPEKPSSRKSKDSKVRTKKKKSNFLDTLNSEMGIDDLPPIEDLHISVPHEQTEPIGTIKSVVDPLVIVEAFPLTPALDLDTVLFLEEGDRALGQVFDVFGQVKQPHYCVRFNSKDHIQSRGIQVGMKVYCAPKTKHTSFVLLGQIQQYKGTDSPWDIPPELQDYSDDEAEREAKRKAKGKKPKPERQQSENTYQPRPRFQPRAFHNQNQPRNYYNPHPRPPPPPPPPRSTYVPTTVAGFRNNNTNPNAYTEAWNDYYYYNYYAQQYQYQQQHQRPQGSPGTSPFTNNIRGRESNPVQAAYMNYYNYQSPPPPPPPPLPKSVPTPRFPNL